jgi:hypothetical protein
VSYAAGARSLASGDGYTAVVDGTRQLIVWWPPLYSLLMAPFDLAGLDVLSAGRLINGVLYCATAVILYFLIAGFPHVHRAVAVLGSAAFLLLPEMVRLHSFLLSEALLIFLVVLFAVVFARHLASGSRYMLLAAAGVAAAASMTRYVGIALVGAGVVMILLTGGGDRRTRVKNATIFGVLASLPFVAWLGLTTFAGNDKPRSFAIHIVAIGEIRSGLGTVSDWFFPSPIPSTARVGLFSLLVGFVVVLSVRVLLTRGSDVIRAVRSLPPAVQTMLVFGVCYLTLVVVTITFLDAQTPLDGRILSPLFVATVVTVPVIAIRLGRGKPAVWIGLASWLVLILCLYGYRTAQDLSVPAQESGLTGRTYSDSGLMGMAADAPDEWIIYSNAADAVSVNTDREDARSIPTESDPHSLHENAQFEEEMKSMGASVGSGGVVLMFDASLHRESYLPTAAEIDSLLPELRRLSVDGGVAFVARTR